MEFEEALVIELNGISRFHDKIYPLTAPESEACPYAVYSLSSVEEIRYINEYSTNTIKATYELNIYEDSYRNMKTSMKLFSDKLRSFASRTIGGSNVYIQNITIVNMIELYETELGIYRGNIELEIFYDRS